MPHKRDAAVSRAPSGASKVLMTRVKRLADTAWMRACLPFFSREKRWINEQHLEVCRVPAPTFREQERADFLGVASVRLAASLGLMTPAMSSHRWFLRRACRLLP